MAFDFSKVFSSFNKSTSTAPPSAVGIDFGASSVKVVEVEMQKDFLQLKTYGELQLGPYGEAPLGSVVELPVGSRTEAVVDILRESEVDTKNGVLTLPLSESFVTTVSLAATEREDISSRINVEARKQIPVPLSDVALEWIEVEPLANAPKSVKEVLIAAIQNKILEESKQILESINMVSQPSEIEIFSAIRAISKESDQSIAVMDFGAHTSKLYIAQGGYIRRIHRAQAGGAQITQRIAQLLQVEFAQAENMKRNYTLEAAHAADIKKAVTSGFDRAMQEFKRVVQQYEMRSGAPVTRIVLTGGSVLFSEFPGFASYALDRQVELANPFTKLGYPAFMEDTLTQIAPTFAVALGAALRPFEQ